ncbi:helix-turn-helix domain-containing protein [Acinetobacter rongchengensis]
MYYWARKFAKAAALLNSSPSSVARLLAALEEKLGMQLVN